MTEDGIATRGGGGVACRRPDDDIVRGSAPGGPPPGADVAADRADPLPLAEEASAYDGRRPPFSGAEPLESTGAATPKIPHTNKCHYPKCGKKTPSISLCQDSSHEDSALTVNAQHPHNNAADLVATIIQLKFPAIWAAVEVPEEHPTLAALANRTHGTVFRMRGRVRPQLNTCALGGAPSAVLSQAQEVGWHGQRLRRVLLPLVVHLLQVLQLRNRVRHVPPPPASAARLACKPGPQKKPLPSASADSAALHYAEGDPLSERIGTAHLQTSLRHSGQGADPVILHNSAASHPSKKQRKQPTITKKPERSLTHRRLNGAG